MFISGIPFLNWTQIVISATFPSEYRFYNGFYEGFSVPCYLQHRYNLVEVDQLVQKGRRKIYTLHIALSLTHYYHGMRGGGNKYLGSDQQLVGCELQHLGSQLPGALQFLDHIPFLTHLS